MATKTIKLSEEAYKTLTRMKQKGESFSQVIHRIGKRRPLSDFFEILKGEDGEKFERIIKERRKERLKRIMKAFQ